MMLDDLDKKLILELQDNGRRSLAELAHKLKASEATVGRHLKRLAEKNIIRIAAIPDLDVIGYGFACIVGIQVDRVDFQSIAHQIASHANVCYLAEVTGRYDFVAIIIARSSEDFSHFLDNVIRKIPGVLRTETFVNLNIYKRQLTSLDTIRLVSGP